MGKGDKRRDQKRLWAKAIAKSPPKGIPELAPIHSSKHRLSRGKDGKFTGKQEDARVTALVARCGVYGSESRGKEARARMAAPWLGDPLGMVLERRLEDPGEVMRYWQVWSDLCRALRTYRLRILGTTGAPSQAPHPLIQSRVEALPDERDDVRTEEEKDADARASWRAWMGRLDKLFGGDRAYLLQAESGTGRALWRGKAPTLTGDLTMRALQRLTEQIERER